MKQTTFGELNTDQQFHPAMRTTTIAGARMWIKKNHKGKPWIKDNDEQARDGEGNFRHVDLNQAVLVE